MIHHLCGVQSLVWFGGFFFKGRIDRAVVRVRGFGYGIWCPPHYIRVGREDPNGNGNGKGGRKGDGVASRSAPGLWKAKHGVVVACDSPKVQLNRKMRCVMMTRKVRYL